MKLKHLILGAVGTTALVLVVMWIMGQFTFTAGLLRNVTNPTKTA